MRPANETPQELYSVDQVAERLGLHVRTVRAYVRDGRLKATRIGKQYRIGRADLEAFTGHPVGPTERETVRRSRHVEVTSIVQIDAISPEAADRMVGTLTASALGRTEPGSLRVESLYFDELGRLKLILVGDLAAVAEAFALVELLGRNQP
jgi:excisionase family DNA binding protein